MYHILIIEDELGALKSISHFLKAKEFVVSICTISGQINEAIIQNKPDLVLLELLHPFNQGLGVCEDISRNSDLPCIIISDKLTTKTLQELFSLGIDDLVAKPFNTNEVILRINSVLKRCKNRN